MNVGRTIFLEDDDGEFLVEKTEIVNETDADYLKALLERVNDATTSLSIAFKTFSEGGIAKPAMGSKLSAYRIAASWIETRLKRLGVYHTGATDKEREQARNITTLLEENRRLRTEIEALKIPSAA